MKQKTILTIALFILILPFLGIPTAWKTFFSILISLILASLAYGHRIKAFFTPNFGHDPIASEAFSQKTNDELL